MLLYMKRLNAIKKHRINQAISKQPQSRQALRELRFGQNILPSSVIFKPQTLQIAFHGSRAGSEG